MQEKTWDECSPRERLKRWEECLRVLQGLSRHEKRHHFNMAEWGIETDCGAVMCAGGFCGNDPWFRRRGFVYSLNGYYKFPRMGPQRFFGLEGVDRIFMMTQSTYAPVVRELRKYLTVLRHRASAA
jgi:hypothetical protein